METRVMLTMESRIHGDMYVRFGGRLVETYHRKVAKRCWPSLLFSDNASFLFQQKTHHPHSFQQPKFGQI